MKFIEDWSPSPAATEALAAYDAMAAEAFAEDVKSTSEKLRLSQLKRFLNSWKVESPTVKKAIAEIDKMIAGEYKQITKEKNERKRTSMLRSFASKYPNSTWGKKAAAATAR